MFELSSIKTLLANTQPSKATQKKFLEEWDNEVCGSLPALYLFTENFYDNIHGWEKNLPHFMSRWRRTLDSGPKHSRVTLDRGRSPLSSNSPHPCKNSLSLLLMSLSMSSSLTNALIPWQSLATSHYQTMSCSWGLISFPPCRISYPSTTKSHWCQKLITAALWLLYIPYTILSTAPTVEKCQRPLKPCPTLPTIKKFPLNSGTPMDLIMSMVLMKKSSPLDYSWSARLVKPNGIQQEEPPAPVDPPRQTYYLT